MMSMWHRQRGFVILSLADIHISIYLPKAGAELETDCTGRESIYEKRGE